MDNAKPHTLQIHLLVHYSCRTLHYRAAKQAQPTIQQATAANGYGTALSYIHLPL